MNSIWLLTWAHQLIPCCPWIELIAYPYVIILHLHPAPTDYLYTHNLHIHSSRLIVRLSYTDFEIAWLIAYSSEVCSPDDLFFIVPSYYERFSTQSCAALLIGIDYLVLTAIPWITPCSPKFSRQLGLLTDTPGDILLAFLRFIVFSCYQLIDRQLRPLIAG